MGYIANFIVYTLAMVGVIVFALLIFKNATSIGEGKSSKYLKIIDSISLGQRKFLYIVSVGNEQFLIAGDVNNTNLISKLDGLTTKDKSCDIKSEIFNKIKPAEDSFKETLNSINKQSYMDRTPLCINSSILKEKSGGNVMKNLANILKN